MIRILVTGDYSPRNRVSKLVEKDEWETVLYEVKELTEQMDYSITNFESAVIDEYDRPIAKCGPCLHCSEKAVKALSWAGFNMVTLANNHFFDYGQTSVEKSISAFQCNHLDYVGGGESLLEAIETFYKTINCKTFAFINCCEHEFSIATSDHGGCNPLDPIQQYYKIKEAKEKADYCIVIVHGGHEQIQLPSLRMKETYRFFIDAGADAVINHHQHCYSGYEIYKGKPIFYGIGNFCFDAGICQLNGWHEGYAVELQFEDDNIGIVLHPYIQCREIPAVLFAKDNKEFDEHIFRLNQIIANERELKRTLEKLYKVTQKDYISIFEPYRNRWLFAAWYRNMLPSFFKGMKCFRAYNYVSCESHLDRLRYVISMLLKK